MRPMGEDALDFFGARFGNPNCPNKQYCTVSAATLSEIHPTKHGYFVSFCVRTLLLASFEGKPKGQPQFWGVQPFKKSY